MRPPASAYPDGRAAAPRRTSGGRRRKGARGAARPSSSILPPGRETERARERRSAPERGDRAERERERGVWVLLFPPPRESTSSHDGTGACRGTGARPAIARGRRRRRPRRLPRAVPTRGLAKARMGGRDGGRSGAGGRTEGGGTAAEPTRRFPGGTRRRETGRERTSRPTAGGSRVPPAAAATAGANAHARARPPRVHPKRARVAARAAAAVPPRFGWCGKTKRRKTNPCVEG